MKNILKSTPKTFALTMLFVMIGFSAMAGNKMLKVKTSAICGMCKDRIELVVNNLDGVKKSLLNLETGIVKIKYNTDKLSETDIRAAIADAGYDADDMPADAKAYSVLPGCCKKGSSCDTKK